MTGLCEGGLDVVSLEVCPTPLTYFSIFHLHLDGAIMVTGSHNPPEYNGFKICAGKDTLHGDKIQELRMRMEAGNFRRPDRIGTRTSHAIIPEYIDYVYNNIQTHLHYSGRKLKVVLDSGNGTAGTVAPPLFKRLGAEIIPLYCDLDGRFPNHHPDPTVPENLRDLIDTVRREKAHLGFAFDGDADRIGLVDENGKIIFGDELMIILSRDVLRTNPGATIISEVKSSHRLYNDIAARGGNALMWKTGHSLIKAKMKETQAALAGEMSGLIFFADRYLGYDDAIYAAARLYEIACRSIVPFSTLTADLPHTVFTPEIRVDCEDNKKFGLVQKTKELLRSQGHSINDIDGVRVDFGDGWGLVRVSSNLPELVLVFEAKTKARMQEIKEFFRARLQKYPEVGPFENE